MFAESVTVVFNKVKFMYQKLKPIIDQKHSEKNTKYCHDPFHWFELLIFVVTF